MALEVVGQEDLALALKLPAEPAGGPARSAIADWIRDTVALRGAIPRDELIERSTQLCTGAGYSRELSHDRVERVITVLLATGDINALDTSSGSLIFSSAGTRISVDNDSDALIGATGIGQADQAEKAVPLCRRVPAEAGSIPLVDYLGYPGIAESFPEIDPADTPDLRGIALRLRDVAMRQNSVQLSGKWERVASLSGSDLCLMTDGQGNWALGLPREEGTAATCLLDHPGQAGWLYLGMRGIVAFSEWPEHLTIPDQILRALGILAIPEDDTFRRWDVPAAAQEFLLGWLGLNDVQTDGGADSDQDRVILAPVSARLLVEAAPGSGKTWTACRRVSQLVNDGVAPTRIVLLSFTRAAVAEIRERIGSLLDEPDFAADITILTLDAFVWRLLLAAEDCPDSVSGHDEAVRFVVRCIEKGERDIVSFLSRIEHLTVDEAQDLTGDRKKLVIAVIRALAHQCGVTVFLDSAQAIYGFTNTDPRAFAEELGEPGSGFRTVHLRNDYRTQTASLKKMIAAARPLLGAPSREPSELYRTVRELIEDSASGKVPAPSNQETNPADGRTFMLFRSRAEVLAATNSMLREGRRFRVRLAGGAGIVEPWIGAVLGGIEGQVVDARQVADLFGQLSPPPLVPFEEAWSILRRNAPSNGAGVDLHRLAKLVSSPNPPTEIVRTDLGYRTGPLLSTIHAAKGREADTVHLMLPRWPERPDTNWMEEARILFVGASRARRKLKIGSSTSILRPLQGSRGRRWRPFTRYGRPDALVQTGIPGDIDIEFQNDPAAWGGETVLAEARERLWRHALRPRPLRAVRDEDRYRLELDEPGERGGTVGWLSRQFGNDLWSIGEHVCGTRTPPPAVFGGIWLLGVTTMASSSETDGQPRIGLAPVVTGIPLVHFSPKV